MDRSSRPAPMNPDRRRRLELERRLFRQYRGSNDPELREALIERYLPLARDVAGGHSVHPEGAEDVFQVACLGLVKAVDRYDPERGVAFSSYAVPTMSGEILRFYRDRSWSVHVARDLQELALKARRVREELTARHGGEATIHHIAAELDLPPAKVGEALKALGALHAESLDAPVREPEATTTRSARVADTDDGYARAEDRALLDGLMAGLQVRDRRIVELYFRHDLTQLQVGQRVGLSQMQVSRILRRVTAELRALARQHREVAA
jgi:RNA polymerase sigma-B factor